MRRAIIACSLILSVTVIRTAAAQERSTRTDSHRTPYVYVINSDDESTSYWPSWKMPNLWPTGVGSWLASSTRSSWRTVSSTTNRAWYATQYTVAPWSKPKPPSLTGSRGITSNKSKAKVKSDCESASWWPKLDFWNSDSEEKKMKTVADWQDQSSPAAGFDE
jgi:hypothetical protein